MKVAQAEIERQRLIIEPPDQNLTPDEFRAYLERSLRAASDHYVAYDNCEVEVRRKPRPVQKWRRG